MTVPVEVPCICEGTPHATDTVFLHEKAPAAMGIAFQAGMRDWLVSPTNLATAQMEAEALIAGVILRFGVVEWTVVDKDGEPLHASPVNIADRLPAGEAAQRVISRGDELYSTELMRPFVEQQRRAMASRASRRPKKPSSPNGQTEASTSVSPSPGPTPLRPSKRSSPTSSAGKPSVVRAS